MPTKKLFTKIFFPTLLGMLLGSVMNVTDGIFVGRGIGSDALASINISAPIFMIANGLSLMFGIGASVTASIALAQGEQKEADRHISLSITFMSALMLLFSLLIMLFKEEVLFLFGCTEALLPYATDYLNWIVPYMIFVCLMFSGMFHIRLDGAPNWAMFCQMFPALLNIVLDYLFIFPLGWGIRGAAIATSLSSLTGCIMVMSYLLFFTKRIRLCGFREQLRRINHPLHTLWQQIKTGISGMFGEFAIAVMLITGNYVFGRYFGENGIAAYSIVCYCTPLLFMFYYAIAQSVQPILSYDYGRGRQERLRSTLRLAYIVTVICSVASTLLIIVLRRPLVYLFVGNSPAYQLAIEGIPCFSAGFLFLAFNIVTIGFYQSVKQSKTATLLTLLRGYLLLIFFFVTLPALIGPAGAWLAIPASEAVTACIALFLFKKQRTGISQ